MFVSNRLSSDRIVDIHATRNFLTLVAVLFKGLQMTYCLAVTKFEVSFVKRDLLLFLFKFDL